MARSAEALVKPELLVWAREAGQIPVEYAAEKMNIPPDKLKSWERGQTRPSVKQLRTLAHVYRLPFAAFYLPEAPSLEHPSVRDYRRFPGTAQPRLTPSINFEIRLALERREVFLELLEQVGEPVPDFKMQATLDDDAETLGVAIRDGLKVTYRQQTSLHDHHRAFNYWRGAIESAGVLVFQAADIDLADMRGFSLGLFPLPVIVVNRKDAYAARAFTMLHELCHILLRTSGLCNLDESADRHREEQRTEVFCNHVAGSALVPAQELLMERTTFTASERKEWRDDDVDELSHRYGVSREVLLRRLLVNKLIDRRFYQTKREALLKELPRKGPGFVPPATDVVSKEGKPFVRLVLNAFGAGRITTSDVSDYLGVRLKHLNKIQEAVSLG